MAKYTSGRQKNLKVGLTSYSESKTSLEVIGKVGIGTTNATSSLHVVGNQFVTGIITASSFSGTATTSITAGSAKTATDVIGGIASVTSLFVNTSGISTLGTVKISSGIVTAIAGSAVTFFGTFVGTASTASFATTAFSLQGFDFNTSTVGSAKTSTDVIGGIASVSQLSVSGFTTVGVLTATRIGIGTTNPTAELWVDGNVFVTGITTLGAVKISSGIITSTTGTAVTYFGDLRGNSDTTGKLKNPVNIGGVSFDGSASISLKGVNIAGDQNTSGTAGSADNLSFGVARGIYFRDSSGSTATTSNNLTFDGNNLKVSGITTVGSGNNGIRIDGTTGIISSSNPGVTTVTYYGTLIGTAQVDVTNITNTSNVIGGIASVTQLYVSGLSTVGVLTATRIGIGTTNPTSELWVGGNVFVTGITTLGTIKISSGIVTATSGVATFFGDFVGTASTASFATTAFTLNTKTENQLNVAFASTAGIATFATKSGVSTDVIGGIASVTSLAVDATGISTLGTVKISSGIVTAIAGSAVTFFGTFVGTASSAGFAQTAFNLDSSASANIRVGFATTATNVIGGIASVTSLSVSGVSTVGVLTATRIGIGTTNPTSELFVVGNSSISGIVTVGVGNTGVVINGISGIITSIGITTVTYFGNLTGTASTASFATTAFNLNASSASNLRVGFATTATNVIGGIASVTSLSVSGVSTVGVLTATRIGIGTTNPTSELFVVGNSSISGIVTVGVGSTGVAINGISGIITSSNPGVTTVTYFGDGSNLTGIKGVSVESQAQVTQSVFPTLAVNSGVNSIGIATTGSTALSFNPSTGSLGIGTTNPTSKLTVNGNAIFVGTGIVTAVEYNGNLRIGTPDGGFKSGAVGIVTADFTKNSINDINSILGKLVPKPPTTIAGVTLTLTGFTGTGFLCSGFTPTNNAGTGVVTPTAGTSYSRNTGTISSGILDQYGPGDSGTVTAFINSVGVGTTTLSSGSNNGTYGSLVISNDKDASFSNKNTGIASGFYEIYDVAISGAPSPSGFNCASIQQGTSVTTKPFWYQDPSTVSAPILSTGTIVVPSASNHQVLYSSGVPHYSQSGSNAFTYVLTCQNASGDMYSNATFCTASGGTSGLISPGNKTYVDFGGSTIPTRNFGVGIGSTTLIIQNLLDTHIQLASPVSFYTYTAQTPYGTSNTPSVTLSKTINIMGSTASISKIDENSIIISSLGSGSATPTRTNAGSGDNPTPVTTGWDETISVATYEATVVGGILKHDQTNYSTGFLPSEGSSGIAPDYSTGRTGSQYFQLQIIRSAVSSFKITVTGTYDGCWVCMPTNTTWMGSLSGTNGWANMLQAYRGSGVPTTADPGCSSGGVMTKSSGTFTCTFGTESSTNDSNNRILVRWKLLSGQSITAMSFSG